MIGISYYLEHHVIRAASEQNLDFQNLAFQETNKNGKEKEEKSRRNRLPFVGENRST